MLGSDLDFAVDFGGGFFLPVFPRKKAPKQPPKNPPQNYRTLFRKIPLGLLKIITDQLKHVWNECKLQLRMLIIWAAISEEALKGEILKGLALENGISL